MAEIIDLATQARISVIEGVLQHTGDKLPAETIRMIAEALVLCEPDSTPTQEP